MTEPLTPDPTRLRLVTQSAAAILDARTPAALRTILENTCERVLAIDGFTFAIYDATTERIQVVDESDALPAAVADTDWEIVIRSGRSTFVKDGSGDLLVPLVDGTRSLGAFRIRPRADRPIEPRDIVLLDAIAALGASALLVLDRMGDARAAETAARRPAVMRELVQLVTAAANQALSFDEAAGVCLAGLCEETGFAVGHAWVLAGAGEFVSTGVFQVRDLGTWGALVGRIAGRRFPHDTGLPGLVASRGGLVRIVDAARDPSVSDLARMGARGIWAFPVRAGREVGAVLALFSPLPLQRDHVLDAAATRLADALGHVLVRDRAEAAARLRTLLLEGAGQAIIGSDAQHRITVWNHAAELLFGWSREEVLGRIDSEFIRVRAEPGQTAEITQRLAAGQPWEGEYEVTRRDGSTVPVLISGAAVGDDATGPAGYVGIAVDLRRSVAAERQRRQSFAMDAVGRLAGAVAHDFNNLLTGIKGVAQLLLDDLPSDSPIRPDLQEISGAAERAASLTARLLAFGRRLVLRPRVVEPASLIRSAEIALRRAAGPDNELALDLDTRSGPVVIDPNQLERALIDLVARARRVTPSGSAITIRSGRIRLGPTEARAFGDLKPGDWVTIDVIDTGPPLAPDVLDRLFEPAPAGAHGLDSELGLGTAYGVIRQSDGVIAVDTSSATGTTVRIWLPLVETKAEPTLASGDAPIQGGDETVLLVEDEPTVRSLARKVLVRLGYDVLEAADGIEALARFERDPDAIDLVITDVIMPSMGGPELVRRLRALRADLPVLLMSGYTDDATLRRGFARSDDVFLEKPFSPATLAQKVRSLLDIHATRG